MRTFTVVAAVLASCGGEPKAPIANTGGAPVSAVPPGWLAIVPDDERLHCANYARDEWQVAIEHDEVVFTEMKQHEPDSGPVLPFTPKQQPAERGRQHVLAVPAGFLVGYDAGEFGGGLWWFSKDGTNATQLGDQNVHGLVEIGPGLIASIEGLSHIIMSEGNVRWIEHASTWRTGALTKLDGAPRTFVAATDALYVLTTESLMRVGKDRKAVAIQPTRTAQMYPNSMTIDASGELWIGMRQFVVRLTPAASRFTETWLVRDTCARATVHGLECVCEP